MEVRPGYKQTEAGVIPEDWEVKPLGEVGGVRMCKRVLKHQTREHGDVPFYKIGTFGGAADAFIPQSLFEEFRRKYSFPNKGDVLISAAGTIGRTVIYDGSPAYFQDSNIVWIDNDESKATNAYLWHRYQVTKWSISHGGTVARLYNDSLRNKIYIPLPLLPEQRAIATALSDVDALLGGLERLIAKKRDLKQAAMQQLLTGQTRLPGFHGEWEVKRLGECLLSRPDYGINAAAVPFSDKLPSYIRITDISEHGHFCPAPRVSVQAASADQYYLREGDVVFARTGASVGKSCLYDSIDGPLVFAGFLIRVRTNPELLVPSFLAAHVTTKPYWNWVRLMSMRSGQPGINGNEYAQLPLSLPPLPEQTAIAAVLSDMDAELSALVARRDKTRDLKQGMMQELLTGRTRLV